jgi:hypothetical protein
MYLTVRNLTGDNSGALHVLSGQTLVADEAVLIHASIHVNQNATAFLPSLFSLSNISAFFYGNVCGVDTILVNSSATLELSLGGFSCGSPVGHFSFSTVIVYATGTVAGNATSPQAHLNASVCVYPGGSVDWLIQDRPQLSGSGNIWQQNYSQLLTLLSVCQISTISTGEGDIATAVTAAAHMATVASTATLSSTTNAATTAVPTSTAAATTAPTSATTSATTASTTAATTATTTAATTATTTGG